MKLEEQVTNLELSKKLKELGVKQESLFYWGKDTENGEYYLQSEENIATESYFFETVISAFTVAELGEMLPITVTDPPIPKDANPWEYDKTTLWIVNRVGDEFNKPVSELGHPKQKYHVVFEEDTEVNARAKMIVYLIENKLIKVKEL